MHAISAIKNDSFYDILVLIKEIPRACNYSCKTGWKKNKVKDESLVFFVPSRYLVGLTPNQNGTFTLHSTASII